MSICPKCNTWVVTDAENQPPRLMTDTELLDAARQALKFLSNQVAGRYNGPSEDILCGEALARALKKWDDKVDGQAGESSLVGNPVGG